MPSSGVGLVSVPINGYCINELLVHYYNNDKPLVKFCKSFAVDRHPGGVGPVG